MLLCAPLHSRRPRNRRTGAITYTASSSVVVTVRSLGKVGAVVGAATEAGAAEGLGASPRSPDQKALHEQAHEKAYDDARAQAEEDWFLEFEAVCSKTQDAMALSTDELRSLLARCEKLKPRVEALDPSRRKVYARRLQLCRDLYQFVVDTREAK